MKSFSLVILLSLAIFAMTGCPGNANTNGNVVVTSNANTGNIGNSIGNMGNTMSNAAGNAYNATSNVMTSNGNANLSNSNANVSTGNAKGTNEFMTDAAQGGMAEVELGTLAASRGANKEVKDFGLKMVGDHTKANNELKALAAKKNIKLPTEIAAKQKEDKEGLAKLSGAAFDSRYVKMMVEDHEKDVAEFQNQANSATDADVKAFAAKTLPVLKSHLEMIKAIQGKMK